jgi:beta-lactamase regulating signal transducer with metallopeptidase domain/HEAT repeat protein
MIMIFDTTILENHPALLIMLDAALKGLAVLGVAAAVTLLMRRASAAARHLVWLLALGALLVLPAMSILLPAWQVPILPPASTVAETPPAEAAVLQSLTRRVEPSSSGDLTPAPARPAWVDSLVAPFPRQDSPAAIAPPPADVQTQVEEPLSTPAPVIDSAPQPAPIHLSAWIIITWITGLAVALLPIVIGLLALRRLARNAMPVTTGPWQRTFNELGLRRRVRLRQSSRCAVPMTWGTLRPIILVPTDSRQSQAGADPELVEGAAPGHSSWTPDRRRAVLLHELAHVQRLDWLTHLLARVACAIHWFNPLAWYALRRLRIERERACDDMVLSVTSRAADYADHLLQIARSARTRAWLSPSAAAIPMARPGQLEGRLLAILDKSRPRRALTRATVLLATLALLILIIPLAMLKAGERTADATAEIALATDAQDPLPAQPPENAHQSFIARFVNTDGDPIPGADVELRVSQSNLPTSRWSGQTDEHGRIEWHEVHPEAERVSATVRARGYRGFTIREFDPSDQEQTIELLRGLRVTGTVTDSRTGEPIDVFTVMGGTGHVGSRSMHFGRDRAMPFDRGRYEWEFWDGRAPAHRLRVEASGYQPAVSRQFVNEEGEVTYDFQLEPAEDLTGLVRLPDGAPVADAVVHLGTATQAIRLTNAPRPGQTVPETGIRFANSLSSPRTQANNEGRFRFDPPGEPYAIVVVHEQGFAEVSEQELQQSDEIVLQPWAAVEGRSVIGGLPNPDRTIMLERSRRVGPVEVRFALEGHTDDDGRFSFEHVLPGEVSVGRKALFDRERTTTWFAEYGQVLAVRAGETARVQLGGRGRPVVGRLTLPPDADRTLDSLFLFGQIAQPVRSASTYAVHVQQDGSFRVEDVLPGEHELSIEAYELHYGPAWGRGPLVGSLTHRFTNPPINGNRDEQPLELPELQLQIDRWVDHANDAGPLESGEVINIHIKDFLGPGIDHELRTRISDDGVVRLPLAGPVELAGLTGPEAEQAIGRAYREADITHNAQVTVRRAAETDADPPTDGADDPEVKERVERAVRTISTLTENDPRVNETMQTLRGLDDIEVSMELSRYLRSEQDTLRRAAIYILWHGPMEDVYSATKPLAHAMTHEEDLTRGMAALAVGQRKLGLRDMLEDMAMRDYSPYARRCAAYALGLLGDSEARPVLEKVLTDPDPSVRNNAQAALTMLEQTDDQGNARPDATNDPALNGLLRQREQALAQLERSRQARGEDHPEVRRLNAQLELLDAQINLRRQQTAVQRQAAAEAAAERREEVPAEPTRPSLIDELTLEQLNRQRDAIRKSLAVLELRPESEARNEQLERWRDSLEHVEASINIIESRPDVPIHTMPDRVVDPQLRQLEMRRQMLIQELALLERRLGERNPRVQEARRLLEDTEEQLADRRQELARRAALDPDIAPAPAHRPPIDPPAHEPRDDILDQLLPEIRFDDVAFADIIEFLRDLTGANIIVNWRALQDVLVDRDTPVSLRARQLTVRQALDLVLANVSNPGSPLDYAVHNGSIVISTPEHLQEQRQLWQQRRGEAPLPPTPADVPQPGPAPAEAEPAEQRNGPRYVISVSGMVRGALRIPLPDQPLTLWDAVVRAGVDPEEHAEWRVDFARRPVGEQQFIIRELQERGRHIMLQANDWISVQIPEEEQQRRHEEVIQRANEMRAIIEAGRLHAAEHDGHWPETLDQLKPYLEQGVEIRPEIDAMDLMQGVYGAGGGPPGFGGGGRFGGQPEAQEPVRIHLADIEDLDAYIYRRPARWNELVPVLFAMHPWGVRHSIVIGFGTGTLESVQVDQLPQRLRTLNVEMPQELREQLGEDAAGREWQDDPELAARASLMRQVLLGIHVYGVDHEQRYPAELEDLSPYLRNGLVQEAAAQVTYTRPAERMSEVERPKDVAVLHEREPLREDGRLVGFADGAVQFITDEQRLRELSPDPEDAPPPADEEAAILRDEIELRRQQLERTRRLLEHGRIGSVQVFEAERPLLEAQIRLAELENRPAEVVELLEQLVEGYRQQVQHMEHQVQAGRAQVTDLTEQRIALRRAQARLEQAGQRAEEAANGVSVPVEPEYALHLRHIPRPPRRESMRPAPPDVFGGVGTFVTDQIVGPLRLEKGLQFCLVLPEGEEVDERMIDEYPDPSDPDRRLRVERRILLDESHVERAAVGSVGEDEPQVVTVMVQFNEKGAERFGRVTADNIGRRLAIILDGELVAAPTIHSRIRERAMITRGQRGFTAEQAEDIARRINDAAAAAVREE